MEMESGYNGSQSAENTPYIQKGWVPFSRFEQGIKQ